MPAISAKLQQQGLAADAKPPVIIAAADLASPPLTPVAISPAPPAPGVHQSMREASPLSEHFVGLPTLQLFTSTAATVSAYGIASGLSFSHRVAAPEGAHTPEPNEAPAAEPTVAETPAASSLPLPFGSPAIPSRPEQHSTLLSAPETAISAEAAEDAAFLAAAQAAAAAAGPPAEAAAADPVELHAASPPLQTGSGAKRGRFAKQNSLPLAKRRASSGSETLPLAHALSCQVPSAAAARNADGGAALPRSPPVPGPKVCKFQVVSGFRVSGSVLVFCCACLLTCNRGLEQTTVTLFQICPH